MNNNFKALAFDIFGTLYDINSIVNVVKKVVDRPKAFVELWRSKQLHYCMQYSLMANFRPFSEITKLALLYVINKRKISLDNKALSMLMDSWHNLSPYAEAEDTLNKLKDRYRLVALTNGNPKQVERLLTRSGLRICFDKIISASEVGIYKPSAMVYQLASSKVGCPLNEILMVSSNSFDIMGAKSAGMMACWVNRYREVFDDLSFKPDYEVKDLNDLLYI